MRPLRPLKHSIVQLHARIVGSNAGIGNSRRFHRQQQQFLVRNQRSHMLVRAFSDAVDPLKWESQTNEKDGIDGHADEHNAPLNGIRKTAAASINGGSWEINGEEQVEQDVTPFLEGSELLNGENALHDIDFTAQRIGYPIYEGSDDDDGKIREESREEATAKAERILAILRHSMTELDIGKVVHRVAQYATLPRVTSLSRKQFLRSLETRFGPNHSKEYEYMLAFLHGKDDVIEKLELESRKSIANADSSADVSTEESISTVASHGDNDLLVPEIMGLHPDLVADPKFIGVVFCYCRLACLNSLKLVQRPSPGHHRGAKSSLWQVKNDFRKVLDIEGYSHFAEMMGLEKQPPASVMYDVDAVDAEWEEFNLENDRIDFRMLVSQTQELIEYMKKELPNETISKMLIAMLASVKTSKLHRKIFQEMVCNIQTAFPEQYHEDVLSKLVPFLSGNNATYEDFESELATSALQHHRLRHEAILRALLESRMRVGHILIHDIDEVDPMHSVSTKLSPEMREKVITTAWNIVSVLDDRQYHMFFSRFLKYKLAWRPNRTTFGQTFLDDARKTLGPRCADAIMPLFEETFHHLSVETLTICRVKLRHSHKLIRERAAVAALNDAGQERLESTWQPSRSVFYRNLPHGVTEKHLREALEHVGEVKRFVFFSTPVNGPPEDATSGRHDGDSENLDYLAELDNDFSEDGEEGVVTKKKARGVVKELKTPRKKTHVIASDHKTPYQALVEFASDHGRERALQRALQIFGVMMGGWKEYRPVFSSVPEERTSISVQNIPFGTRVGDLMEEINRILEAGGLEMKVSSTVPSGVLITNGRMEFRFESFTEAAQAVELLHAHVSQMKSRRPLTGDDMFLETARAKRKEKHVKAVKKATRASAKKQQEELEEAAAALQARKGEQRHHHHGSEFVDEEIVDDEFPDADEDEDEELVKNSLLDEDEETYFSAELEGEDQLTEEDLALREIPRPFDVTWNTPRRSRNKHLYV
uniref:RRM domain-containing protein n=1 Tax=Globisporangium ultimum (strain ATCC 200006 / CBS 805.95 / DAOM BR144) TaxID=431595 RepID=K3WR74_GLOUD